jgi:hypothetical protein
MGTYNSKDESEINDIKKRRNQLTNNNNTIINKTKSNVPSYNTLRSKCNEDTLTKTFKQCFYYYINNNNNNNEDNVTYIVLPHRNSFSYTTSLYIKSIFTYSSSPHSLSFTSSSLNTSDYIDISSTPLLSLSPPQPHSHPYRNKYYSSLIVNNIWTPLSKPKQHNTIIFFDWDDTLMCTSYLTPSGIFSEDINIPDKDKDKIKSLDVLVHKMLMKSIEKGTVFIITNAAPGWVEYSAKRFYPTAAQCLKDVNVISARGMFEKVYPGDTRLWKVKTFHNVLKEVNKELITNLICIGDSIIEIDAGHNVAKLFTHVYIKTVKFKENPSPMELHKQLTLILGQFDKVCSAVKNMAIRVEKKKNETEMN